MTQTVCEDGSGEFFQSRCGRRFRAEFSARDCRSPQLRCLVLRHTCIFLRHIWAALSSNTTMDGKSPIAARSRLVICADPERTVSFVETGRPEPRPRLLVDRLLHARMLLQASPILRPRFQLGDCAAAHHIVLGDAAAGHTAVDRLLAHGFRVEPSPSPPGIRFFVSSSHVEAEIHALLVAIIAVVQELAAPAVRARPRWLRPS